MNIIILGAPGSGKGTQAKDLAKKFNLFYFSAGDLARKLAEEDSRINKIVNKKGGLIPDDEMTSYVEKYLAKKITTEDINIIFDGYPRFVSQYEALEKWLEKRGSKIDVAILLEISEEEAVKRLALRKRKDDNLETIKTRFKYYRDNTKKLIDHIDSIGKLIKVDGERPIDVIQKDLVKILEKISTA